MIGRKFICNSISLSLSAIIIPLRNRFPDSHLSPLQLCCKDLGYLHLRFHPTYQSRAYTVFNWTVSSEMIALAVRANCPRATTLRYLRMSFDRMRKIARVETIVIIRSFGETKLIFWSKFSIEIFNMYVYIYIYTYIEQTSHPDRIDWYRYICTVTVQGLIGSHAESS